MNRYSQYIELLTEETLDHTVGNAVSPTHIASAVSEHGRGVRLRVEPRETR